MRFTRNYGIGVHATRRVELAFGRISSSVHLPDEREDALRDLRDLVAKGTRSVNWNFRAHAAIAKNAGDVDAPLFFALAAVLSGKADAATLATFPRWTGLVHATNGHGST